MVANLINSGCVRRSWLRNPMTHFTQAEATGHQSSAGAWGARAGRDSRSYFFRGFCGVAIKLPTSMRDGPKFPNISIAHSDILT